MTRLLQECYHDLRRQEKLTGFSAVICATVVDRAQLPAPLKAHFKHEVVFNVSLSLTTVMLQINLLFHRLQKRIFVFEFYRCLSMGFR